MKKRNIIIALFLITIISITAFLYSKFNAEQLTFPILSQSSQLFLYHDYLYYTDYDQTEQVFRLNRTLLKDHNLGRQAEIIFRCPNQNGSIELFMQKDSLYFTYKSSNSPSLSTHNTYKITPTGACEELLLNRRMKFDLYADGIVLASFFPMETQNNLYSYRQGIFENISGDENLYYQDLIVHENSVYAIAKYTNSEDTKYPPYPTLYKIDIKTKEVSCLSGHYVNQFALGQEKNKIYYISSNDLYCINLNGTAPEELVDQNVECFTLASVKGTFLDTIIFIGKNGNGLYKIDLTSKSVDEILPPKYIIQNFIYNNNLLAIKLNNKYLGFMIIDIKGNWVHLSNKTVSQFAFDGCTAIYLTNNDELYLRDIQYHVPIDPGVFSFIPPQGALVQDLRSGQYPPKTNPAQLNSLAEARKTLSFSIFIPTSVLEGLVPEPPTIDEGPPAHINVNYQAEDGSIGLGVINSPAGSGLDADPRKTGETIKIRGNIVGHFLDNEAQFGGPILWWEEAGSYVALSGPELNKADLVNIANSMSATADLK